MADFVCQNTVESCSARVGTSMGVLSLRIFGNAGYKEYEHIMLDLRF